MSDFKKMSMSELIAKHNELNPSSPVTEFKSLAAGRAAVETLEKKMSQPEGVTAHTTADTSKYSTSGKRGPTQGVGNFAKELIKSGLDNKTVLEKVLVQFPSAKTTTSCIAYYRTALKGGIKKKGTTVDPAALEAKAQELLDKAKAAREAAAKAAEEAAAKAQAAAEAAAQPA